MRTTASTRQATRADLASAPKVLDWAVYIRQNVKLTASARSLAFLLITLGQGQNITMSQANMAKSIGMRRDTVAKAIDELHRLGLLVVKGNGRNRTTVYRLTMPVQVAPVEDQPVVPVEDQLVDLQEDQLVVPVEDHNIEEEQEEATGTATSTSDDDVAAAAATPSGKTNIRAKATARTTSTRAKDDYPAIEVYISDIEDVVDELEHRLGMTPGTVNIKALAKLWRELMIRHGEKEAGVSAAVETFPADHPMWGRCAGKVHPVGYFLDEQDRWLSDDNNE